MIRPFCQQDLAEIFAIEQATQQAPWSLGIFQRCLDIGYLGWVYENGKNIIGFIVASLLVGELHILNISVRPNYQRQGYGQQLLDYALETAKTRGAIIALLEVRHSNQQAISLYRKLGFSEIDIRKNYYPGPTTTEDALVFAKDFSVE